MDLYEKFENGELRIPNKILEFRNIVWNKHKNFEGVELKHIITGEYTNNEFSYHLVRIYPNDSIGFHIHENQLETHEVILGNGKAINNGIVIDYKPGVISIFKKGVEHKVVAGEEGLYIFAKFIPALC